MKVHISLIFLVLTFFLPACFAQTCPSYKYWDTSTSTCLTCSYFCKACTSSTDCTLCDSATDHRVLVNQKACMCQTGYYDNKVTSVCQACTTRISNCADCYYNSTYSASDSAAGAIQYGCSACLTGYVLLNNACSVYVICPAGQGPNQLTNQCQACETGCLTCTFSTVCTQCNQALNYFLDTSTSKCILCSLFGCSQCESLTACTTCSAGLILTQSKTCSCPDGKFYNPYTTSCVTCSIYCKTCSGPSSYECTSCESTHNRLLVGSDCQCDSFNYVQSASGAQCIKINNDTCQRGYIKVERTGQCVEICGDGWRIDYECDDGGVVNTDGCSDACKKETGFQCLNTGTAASICRLTVEVQFQQFEVVKNQTANSLNFKIDVSPDSVIYSNYNLAQIMHFRGGFFTITSAYYQNGWLYIKADYNRNLQGKSVQLQIKQDSLFDAAYPESYQTLFNTTKSTFTLSSELIPLLTQNNLKPNYYTDQTYSQVERTKTGGLAVMIIMVIISIASLFIKNSLSILVNVNAFQISYLSLVTVNGMHPVMAAIKVVRPVLGVNQLDMFDLSGEPTVRVKGIGFVQDFANNFNLMFFIQCSFLVASVLTGLASHKKPMIKLASSILQRNTLLIIMFNLPTVFFTLTLMIKPFIINISFGAAASLVIIYQVAHLLLKGKDYFAFKEVFDFSSNGHFKKFIVVYFLARLGTCLSFSFISVEPLKSLIAGAAFEGAFILFISFVRPFYHSLNNIFMIVAQIMAISFFGSVYASEAEESLGKNDREKSVDVMVYLVGAIMLVSLANFIYSLIIDIKQGGKKLRAFNELVQAKHRSDKQQA